MRHQKLVGMDYDDDVVALAELNVFVDVDAIRVQIPFVFNTWTLSSRRHPAVMTMGLHGQVVTQVDRLDTPVVPLGDLTIAVVGRDLDVNLMTPPGELAVPGLP